jgi:Fic family protein
MDAKEFKLSSSGKCSKTVQGYHAFIPNPLPPHIDYTPELVKLISEADRPLSELSGTGRVLPNPYLLVYPYMRREAVSSSRIEGTQSSLNDLFFFEAAPDSAPPNSDVREVQNYVLAMEYGLNRLKDLPISIRLIREIHEILMQGVRGEHATPGELRRSQNWIGPPGCFLADAVYVPPPVEEMHQALSDWEKYLHSNPMEPPLIQCALMHYQFEAIHPFLDGNGRIGRLLVTFFLCERGHLSQPLLYLSEFFEKNRAEYYSLLLRVSRKGDWKEWIEFFLRGLAVSAKNALSDALDLLSLHEEYVRVLEKEKKHPASARRIVDEIFLNPVLSISGLSRKWNLPFNSVKSGVEKLIHLGILQQANTKSRNRLFIASRLMNLLTSKQES